MVQASQTAFDTIESAQDFIRVLGETITEARQEIEVDLARELQSPPSRRTRALQIAAYNLEKLEKQMTRSRRVLNDLRSLRRLLFAERQFHHVRSAHTDSKFETQATPAVVAAIPAPKTLVTPVMSVQPSQPAALVRL